MTLWLLWFRHERDYPLDDISILTGVFTDEKSADQVKMNLESRWSYYWIQKIQANEEIDD